MALSNQKIKNILPQTCQIARDAGDIIMSYYKNGTTVEIKKDSKGIPSPVTEADKTAEIYILAKLKELTPDIPIVSEEAISAGARPDTSGGTFWTVDPLDGTKLFIERQAGFRVLIGLVVDHKPVLGVALHPKSGILYSAAGPGTATKTNANGTQTKISTRTVPNKGAQIILNKNYARLTDVFNHISAKTIKKSARHVKANDLKLGKHNVNSLHYNQDTYEFCQIAEGRRDSHIHVSKSKGDGTNWWDIVPGHAILDAAGGCIQDFKGNEISYKNDGKHDSYRVPPFVALGDKKTYSPPLFSRKKTGLKK